MMCSHRICIVSILRSSFIIAHPDLLCTKMKTELNGVINNCFIIILLEKNILENEYRKIVAFILYHVFHTYNS